MPTVKKRPCCRCGTPHQGFKDVCGQCVRKSTPRPKCPLCGRPIADGSGGRHFCSNPCSRIYHAARARALYPLNKAVKEGRVLPAKGQVCSCGAPAEVLEHRRYLQPLNVEPCCRSCNSVRGLAEDVVDVVCVYFGVSRDRVSELAISYGAHVAASHGGASLAPLEFAIRYLDFLKGGPK